MDEVFYGTVEATCEYEGSRRVKARRPFKLVRDVRGRLHTADMPPALECLDTAACALKKVPCLQAFRKHPESYPDAAPDDIKRFQDYLNPQTPETD